MNKIEKLTEHLRATPNDSFLQHALALEHIKVGNDSSAKNLFEHILAVEPSYVGSYYHLAKCLEKLGQIPEAIVCYEKGMAVCKIMKEEHAYRELQAAYEDLTF